MQPSADRSPSLPRSPPKGGATAGSGERPHNLSAPGQRLGALSFPPLSSHVPLRNSRTRARSPAGAGEDALALRRRGGGRGAHGARHHRRDRRRRGPQRRQRAALALRDPRRGRRAHAASRSSAAAPRARSPSRPPSPSRCCSWRGCPPRSWRSRSPRWSPTPRIASRSPRRSSTSPSTRSRWRAAGAIADLISAVPRADVAPHYAAGDLPAILLSGAIFFAVNSVLVATVISLSQGFGLWGYYSRDLVFQASNAGMSLGLAPIIALAAGFSLALLPLLVLPLLAIYRGGRQALQIEHQSLHDALTVAPQPRAAARPHRPGHPRRPAATGASVAVMLIDLDHFKEVNDTLGHHHGDLLLREIGPRLGQTLRDVGHHRAPGRRRVRDPPAQRARRLLRDGGRAQDHPGRWSGPSTSRASRSRWAPASASPAIRSTAPTSTRWSSAPTSRCTSPRARRPGWRSTTPSRTSTARAA